MSRVWGLTERGSYWLAHFAPRTMGHRREGLLWTCGRNPQQEKRLREQAEIYDPFVGLATPEGVATCLGVFNTRGYSTPQGLTVELLPLEPIPNPIPISTLLSAKALPVECAADLLDCGSLHPLQAVHWTTLKSVITKTNPLLALSLMTVENWRQRRHYLEQILECLALRGCGEDQEQDLFAILRTLIQDDPGRSEPAGPLIWQTRLRVALKAQMLPEKEWQKLCQQVVDAWYGYVMTLTSAEIARLADINTSADL